jgi:TonB family protein
MRALGVLLACAVAGALHCAPPAPPRAGGARLPANRDAIQGVIRSHGADVHACYARRVAEKPGLRGKLVVVFTILEDGTVMDARAERSTLQDPTLERCVLDQVSRWRFPEMLDALTLATPFVFPPSGP